MRSTLLSLDKGAPISMARAALFRSCLAELLWLTNTRVDLKHAVSVLSKAKEEVQQADWDALERVMDYLKCHSKRAIVMRPGGTLKVVLAADASFASESGSLSRSGFVVSLRGTGTVSFGSRKQSSIAISTTDAELNAQVDALPCALKAQILIREMLGVGAVKQIVIQQDNDASTIISTLGHHRSNNSSRKMQNVRHAFLKELSDRGETRYVHVGSAHMTADALTKTMPRKFFEGHMNGIFDCATLPPSLDAMLGTAVSRGCLPLSRLGF